MRKYIYVCPRCGRAFIRFIPRRKMHCPVCDAIWKTRKAKGTQSQFSWKATIIVAFSIAAIILYVLYETDLIH